MKIVPFEIPLARLFKPSKEAPLSDYQVVAHATPSEAADPDTIERIADTLLEVLEEHGRHLALGPVVGYSLATGELELEFTVEARSAEELHKKLGQITRLLEREDALTYHDSSASRLDPEHEAALLA